MTVEQTNVVDFISTELNSGEVVLTISDHLEWDAEGEHLLLLQEKLNTYLAFLESGEIFESYPNARNKTISINIVCKYSPDQSATKFFAIAEEIVKGAGFGLSWEVLEA